MNKINSVDIELKEIDTIYDSLRASLYFLSIDDFNSAVECLDEKSAYVILCICDKDYPFKLAAEEWVRRNKHE